MLHCIPLVTPVSKLKATHQEIWHPKHLRSIANLDFFSGLSLLYVQQNISLLISLLKFSFPSTHPNIEFAYLCVYSPRKILLQCEKRKLSAGLPDFCFQKLKSQGEGIRECLTEISRVSWEIYKHRRVFPRKKEVSKAGGWEEWEKQQALSWFPKVAPRGCG